MMESNDVSAETKVRLKTAYIDLDPLDLLQRLRACQDRLWAMAVAPPAARVSRKVAESLPTMSDPAPDSRTDAPAPSRAPSLTAGKVAAADVHWRKARRLYKRSGKPRTWRTRADPFELVWDDVVAMLKVAPNQSTKTILTALQGKYPTVTILLRQRAFCDMTPHETILT